jgi:hypothetical protein
MTSLIPVLLLLKQAGIFLSALADNPGEHAEIIE